MFLSLETFRSTATSWMMKVGMEDDELEDGWKTK